MVEKDENKVKVTVKPSKPIAVKPKVKPVAVKPKAVSKLIAEENETTSEKSYLGGDIDDTYGERQLREHVLNDPDTFAGSIIPQQDSVWCYSEDSGLIYRDTITFIECFYKCFDELIVNMLDQHNRIEDLLAEDPGADLRKVTKLQIWIDEQTGEMKLENDGEGIDIAKHSKKNKYVPEMIFGDLLTSTNYDKNKKRTVGGKNGLGAKIANIFSEEFTVETVDRKRKLKYRQTFRNNMTVAEPPEIVKYTRVPFTRITYKPDFKRFKIDDPSKMQDWLLLKKRVVDAAACTRPYVSVHLNDKKVKIKDFEEYINLYIGNKRETKRVFSKVNDRWEVGVCLSPKGEFEQVSFVNGICTDIGGRHVNHVADNLAKKIGTHIKENSKKKVDIKQAFIKQNLMVFIKSTIENPTFDSQTKRKMTSLVDDFGSKCVLKDEFVEAVVKLGVLKRAEELALFKTKQGLDKATDGNARARKIHHPKLVDAREAGPKRKKVVTLVLTEGDSAANFMAKGIKGMKDEDHKYWGWFPLRGKLLNIRQATVKQLQDNEEIMMIKKIFGLVEDKVYASTKELRYDRLMIMSDYDKDGHHIKGLIMNLFSAKWPSLLKLQDFICDIATPIIKVKKTNKRGKVMDSINFYTEGQFEQWMSENDEGKGWRFKYYKGLGTFEPEEARDLIKNMRVTNYFWDSDEIPVFDKDSKEGGFKTENITAYHFDMAFSKGNEDARKDWLNNGDEPTEFAPKAGVNNKYSYVNFINNQLKEYSKANVARSVPNLMDGFKPSQRKIMYACFKRKLYEELKVAQLAGYVSEHAGYHHGEVSLNETIVSLAQDYVGAGNINLLYPAGSFGSRMGGGKDLKKGDDAAATRYIYTYLSNACRKMFNDMDRPLLKYQLEEGIIIEPEYYLPVIPLILVNGVQGIGTGYSSTVQCYNPVEIMDNQLAYIRGEKMTEMLPWFRGYNGTIEKTKAQSYITVGRWTKLGKDRIRIHEIPVGTNFCKSFKAYIEFLNSLLGDDSKKKHLVTEKKKGGKAGATKVTKTTKGKKSSGKDKKDSSNSTSTGKGSGTLVGLVKDYDIVRATDTDLVVDVEFEDGVLEQELSHKTPYQFEKNMKLAFGFSIKNMHLFDQDGKIKKYDTPCDIIKDFCDVRREYYEKRRQFWIKTHHHEYDKASSRYRFVQEYMDGQLDINRKEECEVIRILETAEPPYPKYSKDADTDDITAPKDPRKKPKEPSYDYLLNMSFRSLTKNKLAQLKKEMDTHEKKFTELEGKTEVELWVEDIEELRDEWKLTYKEWLDTNKITVVGPKKTVMVNLAGKKPPKLSKPTVVTVKPKEKPKVSITVKKT